MTSTISLLYPQHKNMATYKKQHNADNHYLLVYTTLAPSSWTCLSPGTVGVLPKKTRTNLAKLQLLTHVFCGALVPYKNCTTHPLYVLSRPAQARLNQGWC